MSLSEQDDGDRRGTTGRVEREEIWTRSERDDLMSSSCCAGVGEREVGLVGARGTAGLKRFCGRHQSVASVLTVSSTPVALWPRLRRRWRRRWPMEARGGTSGRVRRGTVGAAGDVRGSTVADTGFAAVGPRQGCPHSVLVLRSR